jgi:outer membrane autotransporter protein
VDTFQGILYGTFILSPVSDIDWQINYAVHNYETRRSMPSWGGLVARADYDGWSGHVGAHYDHRIALSENASFTPSVRAEYTKVEDDDYSETGAGIYNLDVDSNDIDELILGIDGTLAVGLGSNALFSVNAGVGFDALDEDGTITASFAGDPGSATFKTTGVDPSPWLARAGANLTIGADDSVQFSAEYDIEVRDDFTNQSAALKLKIPF